MKKDASNFFELATEIKVKNKSKKVAIVESKHVTFAEFLMLSE